MSFAATLVLVATVTTAQAAPGSTCGGAAEWPLWTAYRGRFIEASGRVADRTHGDRTTSEGQAYALFFAVVAGDQDLFDRVLSWTDAHLAGGHLGARLPAWLWGRRGDGSWGVLDDNSASDADAWLAYALSEAARLWDDPRLEALARRVVRSLEREDVIDLPGLGPTLLPAPRGFEVEKGRAWRLNPSYLPPQLARRIAALGQSERWRRALENALLLVERSSRNGLVPDWALYRAGDGFLPDPVTGTVGSYDAIRVYLWRGLLASGDEDAKRLQPATSGLLQYWKKHQEFPDRFDVARGAPLASFTSPGFLAVAASIAAAEGDSDIVLQAKQALETTRRRNLYGHPASYYDQNLAMFALGFLEHRYWFESDGRLAPAWEQRCVRR